MRQYIDIITEAMSRDEAMQVFAKAGQNVSGKSPADLKSILRQLAKTHHPDRGGSLDTMQMLNAAYDTLAKLGTGSSHSGSDSDDRARRRQARADAEDREWSRDKNAKRTYNFRDIRDVKDYLNDLAYKTAANKNVGLRKCFVWNYDGTFFRGCFEVMAVPDTFNEIADKMRQWDFHQSRAVFVSWNSTGSIYLIWSDGDYRKPAIELRHESFNQNPGNDQSFMRKLPAILDGIANGQPVH